MTAFQSRASAQGREFETLVEAQLVFRGWQIHHRRFHPTNGTEIDLVAIDPDGVTWWVECKGSYDQPSTAGLRRNDTIKKAVGTAWFLKYVFPDRPPYLLVVSHRPRPDSVGDRMLTAAMNTGLFNRFECINDIRTEAG